MVALVHQSHDEARKLVSEVPEVDVALMGHNPKYVFAPEKTGKALMLNPGTRCQDPSVLNLTLGSDNAVFEGEGKPVSDSYPKDPDIGPMVTRWETAWKAREKAQGKAKDEGTE